MRILNMPTTERLDVSFGFTWIGQFLAAFSFFTFCQFKKLSSSENCWWLDSNCRCQLLKATTLPTVQQLLSLCTFWLHFCSTFRQLKKMSSSENYWWLDSNSRHQLLEATTLPTVPQSMPLCAFSFHVSFFSLSLYLLLFPLSTFGRADSFCSEHKTDKLSDVKNERKKMSLEREKDFEWSSSKNSSVLVVQCQIFYIKWSYYLGFKDARLAGWVKYFHWRSPLIQKLCLPKSWKR